MVTVESAWQARIALEYTVQGGRTTLSGRERILHDLGAFSMLSSDSQAISRVGDVNIRTWQTAHEPPGAGRRWT